jgi:hypothetical protein
MSMASPFHPGEQRVQTALGVRDRIESWAQKVIRSHMPDQHRAFYQELPFIVIAGRDKQNRPWASLLADRPGFIHSPDAQTLQMHNTLTQGDALFGHLKADTPVGLLGIEFATARRNRMNGVISRDDDNTFDINVKQAFGNCPQYIHARQWYLSSDNTPARTHTTTHLSGQQMSMINEARTFFIASGYDNDKSGAASGMDASHRGGEAGFVQVTSNQSLVWPDYSGNNHFNTVGNLVEDARVGMTFVDFTQGQVLQVTGTAEIDWDSPAVAAVPGAQRLIHVRIDKIVHTHNAFTLRWREPAAAPQLEVFNKIQESDDVASFYLQPVNGQDLAPFKAGQHLPIQLNITANQTLSRTYSLSSDPAESHYRITVKQEPKGAASSYLHQHINIGSRLSTLQPSGDFIHLSSDKPTVLISAGVGITPMASMLSEIIHQTPNHPVWFFHQARHSGHHPLADEIDRQANENSTVTNFTAYSQPLVEDKSNHTGRLKAADIVSQLPDIDAHYYLCGPQAFMAEIQTGLEASGVNPGQIYSESFGH